MKVANVWDMPFITDIEYTNDIKRLQYLIRTGKIRALKIKDKYDASNRPNSTFENGLHKEGISVNYVSDEKPILISNNQVLTNFISPIFYKEHEKEIKDAYYKYFRSKEDGFFNIYSYQYSPKLLNLIIRKRPGSVYFHDIDLSEEDIKKLRANYIKAYTFKDGKELEISSDIVLGNHSYYFLQNNTYVDFEVSDLQKSDLKGIKYIKDNAKIVINNSDGIDEEESFKTIKTFLDELSKTGKHYSIGIPVERRFLFNSIIGKEKYNNININVLNDLHVYSFDEYLDEEKILDDLVKPIIEADLSPLERYLAVYNIVKNYKPYKEIPGDGEEVIGAKESRYIRYILNNEYIVCVGFAKLLETLCDRVGLHVQQASVLVDTSYDNGFTEEEKAVNKNGHQRCYISIDDDKYGVHGIFVADPTWDNELSMNKLSHALMTYTKVANSNRMVWYDIYNPTLDIHSMDDFNKQINYIYKKRYERFMSDPSDIVSLYATFDERVRMERDPKLKDKMTEKYVLLYTYEEIIKSILKEVKCDSGTKEFNVELDSCKNEQDYINLLTKIGNYLLTRVNQEVSDETIIEASVNGTAKIKGLNEEERKKEYESTKRQFDIDEQKNFPYITESVDNHIWTRK